MKKVLGAIAGIFFFAFCIGVIGLMISLTYGAMQRIFPGNFQNQMWGLVLFDIATLAWGLAFVFKSHSLGQYAAAGAGFLVGLIGTLGMIAAEVILSGQALTGGTVDTAQIGQWMIYAFIGCTAIHVILVYAHHAAGPEIAQQISTGVARGQIRDTAIKNAEKQLEAETALLAQDITADIVQSVRRDLQLPIPADPRMPIIPAENYTPVLSQEPKQGFFDRMKRRIRKYQSTASQVRERTISIENTNPTWGDLSGAIMAWIETPSGRERLWCLPCRTDGRDWLSPIPCEHIKTAKPQEKITTEKAMTTLRALMSKTPDEPPNMQGLETTTDPMDDSRMYMPKHPGRAGE